jgi:uncharacterized membrane protein HdeD (DUF308 family)
MPTDKPWLTVAFAVALLGFGAFLVMPGAFALAYKVDWRPEWLPWALAVVGAITIIGGLNMSWWAGHKC